MIARSHVSRACDACRDRKLRCRPPAPGSSRNTAASVSPVVNGSVHSPNVTFDNETPTRDFPTCGECLRRGSACTYERPVAKRGPLPKRPRPDTSSGPNNEEGQDSPRAQVNNGFSPLSNPHQLEDQPASIDVLSERPHSSTPGLTPTASGALDRLNLLRAAQGDSSLLYCLCSPKTWDLVHQDYLEFVYPLIPVVHIPTFRSSLEENRLFANPIFSCLQASMFAVVVAILPGRFQHYKTIDPNLQENENIMDKIQAVTQAHSVFDHIKGPEFYDQPSMLSWATTYLFGAAFACSNLPYRSTMFRSHAYTIMLGMNLHLTGGYVGLNPVETQLRKKALWLTLTGIIHARVFGTMPDLWTDGMARHLQADKLLPLELDDEFISEIGLKEQPPGRLSLTVGFIEEKRILINLTALDSDQTHETHDSANTNPDLDITDSHCTHHPMTATSTAAILLDRLRKLKYGLDDIPQPLSLQDCGHSPSASGDLGGPAFHGTTTYLEVIEMQRVNLYVTNYWAQNYLIERLLSLSSRLYPEQHDQTLRTFDLWERRESLCRDLLHFLENSSIPALQRNGYALVFKIRQIAAALLDCPTQPTALFLPLYSRARSHLKSFTEFLARIDASSING